MTFILKGNALVTVRYDEPKRVPDVHAQRAVKPAGCGRTGETVMAGLIETIIDRAADVLQMAAERIDVISRNVFETERNDPSQRNAELQGTLRALGRKGDLISKHAREHGLGRAHAAVPLRQRCAPRASRRSCARGAHRACATSSRSRSMRRSCRARSSFCSTRRSASSTIEQNNIIKLFSVMAVVFMPPTLIASIYGMNFKLMPELEWPFGYPMAIVLMIVAAVLPYVFFRWKRWL